MSSGAARVISRVAICWRFDMKPQPFDSRSPSSSSKTKRRGVLLGAAAVGAGALTARVLQPQAADAPGAAPKADADNAAGYRESEHVLRYYETTRI
jgi:hypothetical protein